MFPHMAFRVLSYEAKLILYILRSLAEADRSRTFRMSELLKRVWRENEAIGPHSRFCIVKEADGSIEPD